MMLLNVCQKQVPTSELYKQYGTIQLPELFIVIQHHVFFDVFDIKISVFSQYLLSMENDLSTGAEVDWALCNSA